MPLADGVLSSVLRIMRHPLRTRALVCALSTAVAALTATFGCGDSTAPSGVPTAISVEPSQLQLGVGDTARVRIVLLAGTRIVGAESDGWFTWDGTSSSSRIVDEVRTSSMAEITIVGVAPGTDTWRFHYMKKTKCTDPPMCYSSHWYDYLPAQMLEVVVR